MPEYAFALYKPAITFQGVCANMRNAITTKIIEQKEMMTNRAYIDPFSVPRQGLALRNNTMQIGPGIEVYYADRTYNKTGDGYNRTGDGERKYNRYDRRPSRYLNRYSNNTARLGQQRRTSKRCYICKKSGC